MRANHPTLKESVWRWLHLRCPACGKSSLITRPFRIAEMCVACRVLFKREEGFFVGALLINVVTTEVIILLTYLIVSPLLGLDTQYSLGLLFLIAVTFPVAFYHHSWSLWLTFDHLVESLPKADRSL